MPKEKEDYYKVLGVTRDVGEGDLKSAYRKLAMKYHPDRNPGNPKAEEQFKKINEAFEVLSDPQKRQMYDNYGQEGLNMGSGFNTQGFGGFEDVFSSVFDDMFGGSFGGGGARRRTARRGNDLKQQVEISLEEAFEGCEHSVTYSRVDTCEVCHGTGAQEGSGVRTCPTCRGSGVVQFSQGFFSMRQNCPDCNGQGTILEKPCKACRGTGREKHKSSITIKIPQGVRDGVVLRIPNGGDIGSNDGGYGDLYIEIGVKQNDIFQRDGNDLILHKTISYPTAVLGGAIKVVNIRKEELKAVVPAGSKHGSVITLEGEGMPFLGKSGKYGDLKIILGIDVPKKLSPEQKKLITSLGETFGREESEKGFFDKLFGLFF